MSAQLRKVVADEIWQHVYNAFENRPGDAARTSFASKASANDVQFRLMSKIAELKHLAGDDMVDEELIEVIRADVLLCSASGWIAEGTAKEVEELLAKIEEV